MVTPEQMLLMITGINTTKINVPGAGNYAVTFKNGESKELLINGIKFTVKNIYNGSNDFVYSIAKDGKIEFISDYFEIKGELNTAHNVLISGSHNRFYAGNLADNITISGVVNTVYALDGSDDIFINSAYNNIFGGAGNDTLTVNNGLYGAFYGEAGNGIDSIKINGDNNKANGGDSNDSFIVSSGYNNTIDGEGGNRNTLIDKGENTIYSNAIVITSNPFELNLKVDIGSGADKYISTSISFDLIGFSVDLTTAENALASVETIDELIKNVQEQLLNIGTTINRLQSVAEAQTIKLENPISFRSTLRDTDIAEETSDFIKFRILQQASATLLSASGNLKAQNVLGLLQNL